MSSPTPPDSQHSELLSVVTRGAVTALIAQLLGVALVYGTQIALARWMGSREYGRFEYVIACATVASFLVGLGTPRAILRLIPEYSSTQQWGLLRGTVQWVWLQTVGLGAGLAIALSLAISVVNQFHPFPYFGPLQVGVWLVPLQALVSLQIEMGRGIKQIGLAYLPSMALFPVLALGLCGIKEMISPPLTSVEAIACAMLAMMGVLAVQFFLLHRQTIYPLLQVQPVYRIRQWIALALPLMFIDASFLVLNQTDTLMIGAMLDAESVGLYSAALKTAAWVNFVLIAVNAIAAPLFASLYAQQQREQLQTLVSSLAVWLFLPGVAIALVLIGFANPILQTFGTDFVTAKGAMIALIMGQLVNISVGSVGYLLVMTGHQNQCAMVVGVCALLNATLNTILIPLWGIQGAAIATATSMALWNLWMLRLVIHHLQVNPSIAAAIGRWWSER